MQWMKVMVPAEPGAVVSRTGRAVASLITAALTAALAGVLLRPLRFMTALDGLGSGDLRPEDWRRFVLVVLPYGALLGILPIIPNRKLRYSIGSLAILAVCLLISIEATNQTLAGMRSGDSFRALILLSPILITVGLAYLVIITVVSIAMMAGANLVAYALTAARRASQVACLLASIALVTTVTYFDWTRTPTSAAASPGASPCAPQEWTAELAGFALSSIAIERDEASRALTFHGAE